MSQSAPNSDFTADSRTKKYVTPFAFKVHDSLLGKRLASPVRRLAAISIDLLIVALLTTLSNVWLSIIVLLVCINAYLHIHHEPNKKWAKVSLFVASGFAIVMLLFQFVLNDHLVLTEPVVDSDNSSELKQTNKITEFEGYYYSIDIADPDLRNNASCGDDLKCDKSFLIAVLRDMASDDLSNGEIIDSFSELRVFLQKNEMLADDLEDIEANDIAFDYLFDSSQSNDVSLGTGVLDWIKDAVSELGRSFGWAAVYFSALTAWLSGQTIGKKLFGIRVVRIDGKNIDLWESVGRYGGYSAGIATGFLGFLQIYWDGNRQTIQDKISETMVIRNS
ncbi:MAG: RDD family protein [Gammaproteobacteria bacterium]|nr:RDD family protein [Gammaproteobacteria bacterium]